jgi:hypothetical protein
MKLKLFATFFIALYIMFPVGTSAQTQWEGPNGGDWHAEENWSDGTPNVELFAVIDATKSTDIQVKSPTVVQGIEISGDGGVKLDGQAITLGSGFKDTFDSITVKSGDVVINNNLINTDNKRIKLGQNGNSLTLNGDIETGDQTTQIGNLGKGELSFNGNRLGGNSLIIRDGTVTARGILSNTGGGNTQVRNNGLLISCREDGPSIQPGSFGLVLFETGVFRLGTANQIASFVNFAGGKLDMGGYSNDQPVIGNIRVSQDSVIDFSNAKGESLAIADVSGNTEWQAGAKLKIMGFSDGDTLRFGENGTALSKEQLAAIEFDGKAAQIDSDGFVSPSR